LPRIQNAPFNPGFQGMALDFMKCKMLHCEPFVLSDQAKTISGNISTIVASSWKEVGIANLSWEELIKGMIGLSRNT
jgi:hypothetical protein